MKPSHLATKWATQNNNRDKILATSSPGLYVLPEGKGAATIPQTVMPSTTHQAPSHVKYLSWEHKFAMKESDRNMFNSTYVMDLGHVWVITSRTFMWT